MDAGFKQAATLGVKNPLPISWLGRADAPTMLPAWANIEHLSSEEVRKLLAEISYDLSGWDYGKIGENNELGRYQFSTEVLESYGLLAEGSNAAYGTDCVNYVNCWRQVTIRGNNSYANYLFNCTSLRSFLDNIPAQEHLAYQYVYDTYNRLLKIGAILDSDSNDIVAGMIYVGWILGDDAKTWRYLATVDAANYFNSGRYAITVLSQ